MALCLSRPRTLGVKVVIAVMLKSETFRCGAAERVDQSKRSLCKAGGNVHTHTGLDLLISNAV